MLRLINCPLMINASIKEKLKSGELHVKGYQWPIFLYADLIYDRDNPWDGLLRNNIIVTVCRHLAFEYYF